MPQTQDTSLEKLLGTIRNHHPGADFSMVEEAYYFSKNAHKNQVRVSGENYFIHPFNVALLLAQKGLDDVVVASALLHDVVEDTHIDGKEIRRLFGKKVSVLVEGVTKLDLLSFKSRQEQSAANIIKTLAAASKDPRVFVIKMFDKLHNMRTLKFLPKEKQQRIAGDVLTIYVPLVHKLGMHELKYELEDLAFRALEPKK
ncbi:MAG: HD domain-containing protein, partial [archaeon]|nr:HD domain-containing protein [archaeon]